jgi:hypothetical protein
VKSKSHDCKPSTNDAPPHYLLVVFVRSIHIECTGFIKSAKIWENQGRIKEENKPKSDGTKSNGPESGDGGNVQNLAVFGNESREEEI